VAHNPFTFEQIVEMSSEAIWVVDEDHRIGYFNQKASDWLGYQRSDAVGRPVLEFFYPEDFGVMTARLERRRAGQSERYQQRLRRADGSAVWGLLSARACLDDAGRFVGSLIMIADITDLKTADVALRDSEFWLRQSQRMARLGSYVLDVPADRWASSAALDELFGIGPDYERTVAGWLMLVHPDERPNVQNYLVSEVLGRHRPFHLDYRIVTHDTGEVRWVHGLGELTFDAGGNPIRMVGTIQDVTELHRQDEERRELERRLLQAQKLESLGILAGGIAHEYNNLLTSVLGNADLALQDLPPGSPSAENIKAIEVAARRAAEISQQMLAYSGRGRFVVGPLDLSHLVRDMMRMLELSVSKKTVLRVDVAEGLPEVEADAGQLRQVVMNLVANAAEAIGDREGTVHISTTAVDCDGRHEVVDHLGERLEPGRYVVLEVTDSGVGMGHETRARVFDPFFSTKFTGRGLGLPAVLGIVRGHRGSIQVDSQPGRGTAFRVYMPALTASRARTAPPPAAAAQPRTATVLVVDDEDSVRTLAERMVQRCGFDAVGAADGVEAVRMVRNEPGRFSCVLLDLTMPKMGGEDTLREIRQVAPALPVILCSGYQAQELSERFAERDFTGFVQKPYRLADIMATLQAALAQYRSFVG
jgi:two-component system, cell cycle sensor histidine kinase and response regulator CckA